MLTIRKPFGIWCSTWATLASPTRIDEREPSPGAFGLVRKFLKECRPSCIVYRFRKQPTRQAFYVQVFDKNDSVVVDDLSRQLVLKIVALVENFAVNLGYDANRFLPALGKLLATCDSTLCSTKMLLGLLEPTRITNSLSVVPRHTRQQPDIQTNRLIVRWQWFRHYHATETGIPRAVLTFERERLDLAFDRTVQLNLDLANLRKPQTAIQLEPGLRLGVFHDCFGRSDSTSKRSIRRKFSGRDRISPLGCGGAPSSDIEGVHRAAESPALTFLRRSPVPYIPA